MAEKTEREMLAEVIREELASLAAENDSANGIPAQTRKAEPFVLNVGGQTYSFNTKEEAEAAVTQTFQTFRNELAKPKEAPTKDEGAYVTGKEETFDQSRYIDLMGKDIVQAQNYALDHVLGIPNAAQALKANIQEAHDLKATVAVYQFRELHPEFPMTPEATKVVDGLRRELNQPFTLQGLQAAYGVAQTRGLLPSPQVLAYQQRLIQEGVLPDPNRPQQQEQQNPYQRGPLGYQPPPTVNRGTAAAPPDLASLAEDMSLEQLEKVLRKHGQL